LLVSGLASLPVSAQEVLHAFVGDESQWDVLIREFSAIGDVNADGVMDFLYGSPGAHMHRVRSGKDWSTLARYRSTYRPHYPDSHGTSVTGVGFWDDDDVPDYAVGASHAFTTQFYEGAVRVFSGATHTLIQEFTGHAPWERIGVKVFGLGDLDGDGHFELATTGLMEQWVRIYCSRSDSVFREHSALWFSGNKGTPVASYGDWDGDGCRDYLIGEGTYPFLPGSKGRVRLFSGRTGVELLEMAGNREEELTGASVCVAGDWNGDGIDDIAAGAPGSLGPANGPRCGVYIFSGADGSILRFLDGSGYTEEKAGFGYSTVSGKDVNGDGFPDLLVGAPAETVQPPHYREGAVYVISGRTGSVLWRLEGPPDDDYNLGRYVYLIDDHDGDGLAEWVVSDPQFIPPGSIYPRGRITIYRGAFGDRWDGCPTTPNSAGPGASLHASGPISRRCNALELSVTEAPPSAAAQLVYGTPGPPTPFGAGTLCVAGTPHLATSVVTDTGGAALFPIDLWQPPFDSGPAAVAIGDTVAFQVLYADQPAGTRNASNSIVIQLLP